MATNAITFELDATYRETEEHQNVIFISAWTVDECTDSFGNPDECDNTPLWKEFLACAGFATIPSYV